MPELLAALDAFLQCIATAASWSIDSTRVLITNGCGAAITQRFEAAESDLED